MRRERVLFDGKRLDCDLCGIVERVCGGKHKGMTVAWLLTDNNAAANRILVLRFVSNDADGGS
jgi:hypothetical protein